MKREVFEKGRLLEVYTDINDDGFGLGEVSEWDDDYLLLKEYTPFGEQDGVGLYSIGDIYKTAYDTEYCRKILRLASLLQEERTFRAFITTVSRRENRKRLCGRRKPGKRKSKLSANLHRFRKICVPVRCRRKSGGGGRIFENMQKIFFFGSSFGKTP